MDPPPFGPAAVEVILLIVSVAVLGFCAWILFRHLAWTRRQDTLRSLLDSADSLEEKLQSCRRKMQELAAMVAGLPGSQGSEVLPALNAETTIQEALKQILSHRLWIARNGNTARQAELDAALEALLSNSASISAQLTRLDGASAELKRAAERHQAALERAPDSPERGISVAQADRSRLH